jgi:hypothetical protein
LAQQGSGPRRPAPEPGQPYGRHEGYGRHDSGRATRADRPAHWDRFEKLEPDEETELPSWAGPDGYAQPARRPTPTRLRAPDPYRDEYAAGLEAPAEAEAPPVTRTARRLAGRRAAAARLRRSRRRVIRWGGLAIVVCVIAAVATTIALRQPATRLPYVTSLQKGEFESVPDSCTDVTTAVLNQYLPPTGRTTTNELSEPTNSECTFTVDRKPLFVVLEVDAQAYQPFAAASGDGSASQNALDSMKVARAALAAPGKLSPLPPAAITSLAGFGQQAISALQHEHVAGIITDVVHVLVLERNVLLTISASGQESGHGFGPVPDTTLEAAAQAAARSVLAKVATQPTA